MKKASSMIELVIAIVVMGIAMMSLPLMLTRTQSNNEFAMQQEAILAARTQIGDILTYRWDENSTNSKFVSAVLDTNSTNFKRYPDENSTRRIGHVKGDKRRKFFNAITPATSVAHLGNLFDGNDTDDIDDFKDTNKTVVDSSEITNLDYRFDFNMTTNVGYVSDAFIPGKTFVFNTATLGTTTNIKMVELTLKGAGLSTFKFRAYTTNIGQGQLLRRVYN
jgi:type II secretory pathway pseudopilin PulG